MIVLRVDLSRELTEVMIKMSVLQLAPLLITKFSKIRMAANLSPRSGIVHLIQVLEQFALLYLKILFGLNSENAQRTLVLAQISLSYHTHNHPAQYGA